MKTEPDKTGQTRSKSTRERILTAAVTCFAKDGYTHTSVRDITKKANCNLAAVNYHYGGKDKLYTEVFRQLTKRLRDKRITPIRMMMEKQSVEDMTLEELLRAFAEAFLGPLLENEDNKGGSQFIHLIMREMLDPRLPPELFANEVVRPVQKVWREALLRVCPGLNETNARLCIQSMIAQLIHSFRPQKLFSNAGTYPVDKNAAVDHIVRFTAAGMRDYTESEL
ncbi:MAG: TetR/AcrR family transcriptional regulator [Sedimentisphaerales bacterium]|nr:TetR/AcrR family transcriptional regulator [Sedimentisphaerales bacterium]